MLLIREIMFCKPGKVRPLVEKFLAMSKIGAQHGMPAFKVMTDLSSERYWMVVAEMEAASLKDFDDMMSGKESQTKTWRENGTAFTPSPEPRWRRPALPPSLQAASSRFSLPP